MSHIFESAVLMKNNETQRKGLDTIFSIFIMTKIDLFLQNKSWMLLSPLTTNGSYSDKKYLMLLFPFHRNYSKIIINNGHSSTTPADAEESTVYKAMLQATLALMKN